MKYALDFEDLAWKNITYLINLNNLYWYTDNILDLLG